MTLTEKEKRAKDIVNRIRKEHGLRALGKLKRGISQHPRYCTIAMSLHDAEPALGYQPYYCPDWAREMLGEPDLEAFMLAYDEGKYPNLEIAKTPVKIKYPGDRKATVIA